MIETETRGQIDLESLSLPKVSRPMVEDIVKSIESGKWKPNTRMKSTRELAANYHISYVSAANALEVLSRAGLIKRKPGCGTFIAEQREAQKSLALKIIFPEESGDHLTPEQIMRSMTRYLQNQVDVRVSICYVGTDDDGNVDERGVEQILKTSFDSAVLFSILDKSVIKRLKDNSISVTVIGAPIPDVPGINSISFDLETEIYRVVRRLQKAGYDEFFLAESYSFSKGIAATRQGYFSALGIDENEYRQHQPVVVDTLGPEGLRRQGESIVSRIDKSRRTAVISMLSRAAEAVMDAAERRQMRVPEDFAIVVLGGNSPGCRQYSCWMPPTDVCGREVAEMVLETSRTGAYREMLLTNRYVPGFSCRE